MDEPSQRVRRYPDHTGSIWNRARRARASTVGRVCRTLHRQYGQPRFGNPSDPLDDLIYIVLSNRTSPAAAASTYRLLKEVFPTWEHAVRCPPDRLRTLLKPIGLYQKRSRQIRAALRCIRRDLGVCDLGALSERDDESVHAYLAGLPGVSDKVAKCVMMYALGRRVLPVDAHVHRVSVRLGWVNRKRADQCHEELEALVPPDFRFTFHVTCIAHGRAVCRPERPHCERCVIRRDCDFYKSACGA